MNNGGPGGLPSSDAEDRTEKAIRDNNVLWDEWTAIHATSAFYDLDGFRRGGVRLADYEIAEIGDVAGRDLLHLQCHFGIDTLSWARLGARVNGARRAADLRGPGFLRGSDGEVAATVEHSWDHGLGEIVTALIEAGFQIESLREFPFAAWKLDFLVEDPDGRFRLPKGTPGELPLFFSLKARKPAR